MCFLSYPTHDRDQAAVYSHPKMLLATISQLRTRWRGAQEVQGSLGDGDRKGEHPEVYCTSPDSPEVAKTKEQRYRRRERLKRAEALELQLSFRPNLRDEPPASRTGFRPSRCTRCSRVPLRWSVLTRYRALQGSASSFKTLTSLPRQIARRATRSRRASPFVAGSAVAG